VVYLIYRSYYLYLGRMEDEKKHAEEMASLHLRTIEALALAIEAKDHTTHDHLQRVQIYAVEVGKELGLDESELEALRAAAVLHDIGKLAVPEHIISKPGKLTREEFEKMKIHPVVGAEILERVRFPYPVTPIVRSHHERWDGTGYPDGCGRRDSHRRAHSGGGGLPGRAGFAPAISPGAAAGRSHAERWPSESGKASIPGGGGAAAPLYRAGSHGASRTKVEKAKLSTGVKVERGLEPAAGFEKAKGGRPAALEIRRRTSSTPSPRRARRCRTCLSWRRTWAILSA
jgi:putative nucleotidyltransferase with HDIG domain